MPKTHRIFVLYVLIASCAAPTINRPTSTPSIVPSVTPQPTSIVLPEVRIVRHPQPMDMSIYFPERTSIPTFDPNSTDPFQVDLRSQNLTKLDLSTSKSDLLFAEFDDRTQWPKADRMPADFNWQLIMEIGKDPGLGIRTLHDQGITGKGVAIAMIDQTLLVDHIEYKDRIRLYEEADDIVGNWQQVQMHGPAVASIAVGKTVGVAPEADLYYIANGDCGGATSMNDLDFSCLARSVRRIIEINKSLPPDRKIRVLSMSIGWVPPNKGYDEITAAVEEAKSAGIFVISSSLERTYGLWFHGLGRESLSDPNQFTSYVPGLWWQNEFYKNGIAMKTLLVPMDSRTTASPTGVEDYVFYRQGGWSWSIPYIAGMYALAVQVKPEITPERFWSIALRTGKTISLPYDGREYPFGVILDPQALIAALKSE